MSDYSKESTKHDDAKILLCSSKLTMIIDRIPAALSGKIEIDFVVGDQLIWTKAAIR